MGFFSFKDGVDACTTWTSVTSRESGQISKGGLKVAGANWKQVQGAKCAFRQVLRSYR